MIKPRFTPGFQSVQGLEAVPGGPPGIIRGGHVQPGGDIGVGDFGDETEKSEAEGVVVSSPLRKQFPVGGQSDGEHALKAAFRFPPYPRGAIGEIGPLPPWWWQFVPAPAHRCRRRKPRPSPRYLPA